MGRGQMLAVGKTFRSFHTKLMVHCIASLAAGIPFRDAKLIVTFVEALHGWQSFTPLSFKRVQILCASKQQKAFKH